MVWFQALDSTVRRDKSGPHFRYHDDPFLTPQTTVEKRTFSLSKESGRKAANWVLNTHPELFLANTADDPVIKVGNGNIRMGHQKDAGVILEL